MLHSCEAARLWPDWSGPPWEPGALVQARISGSVGAAGDHSEWHMAIPGKRKTLVLQLSLWKPANLHSGPLQDEQGKHGQQQPLWD